MHASLQRWGAVALAAGSVAALLGGCDRGLPSGLSEGPARLTIQLSMAAPTGGPAEAYAKTDHLWVRARQGDQTRLDQVLAFDPTGAETQVSIEVPLEQLSEALTLEIELRQGTTAIFQGSADIQLQVGQTNNVEVPLMPVAVALQLPANLPTLEAYGATLQLNAAAVFATGDTVPGRTVSWSTLDPDVVSVSATGLVTALSDGDARVVATAGELTATATVTVFAAVSTIEVDPPTATVNPGATVQLQAIPKDSRGHVLQDRPLTWSSLDPAIATVDANGLVAGLTTGTAHIQAASGNATGTAVITVTRPLPIVSTLPVTGISSSGVTLHGSVNPNGSPTNARFEYGKDPTLTVAGSTGSVALGSGSVPVDFSQNLGSLEPLTTYYYRVAATNEGGTTRGQIMSFTTTAGPPYAVTLPGSVPDPYTFIMYGRVNPNGAATDVYFEWAIAGCIGNPGGDCIITPTKVQSVGSGATDVDVSDVVGDECCYDFEYRVVAVNEYGTTYGALVTVSLPAVGLQPTPDVPILRSKKRGSGSSTDRDTPAILERRR